MKENMKAPESHNNYCMASANCSKLQAAVVENISFKIRNTMKQVGMYACVSMYVMCMFCVYIIILCVWHHNYLWCEQAVLQMREKDTVQSHSLLQHNVVHEPLQHCVYLWYTPQTTHTITAPTLLYTSLHTR